MTAHSIEFSLFQSNIDFSFVFTQVFSAIQNTNSWIKLLILLFSSFTNNRSLTIDDLIKGTHISLCYNLIEYHVVYRLMCNLSLAW